MQHDYRYKYFIPTCRIGILAPKDREAPVGQAVSALCLAPLKPSLVWYFKSGVVSTVPVVDLSCASRFFSVYSGFPSSPNQLSVGKVYKKM